LHILKISITIQKLPDPTQNGTSVAPTSQF